MLSKPQLLDPTSSFTISTLAVISSLQPTFNPLLAACLYLTFPSIANYLMTPIAHLYWSFPFADLYLYLSCFASGSTHPPVTASPTVSISLGRDSPLQNRTLLT